MGCWASRGQVVSLQVQPSFQKLSSPHAAIKPQYDVIVIGSGYGGSIAASRCARAGQAVCVLERGKEWLPGDFPETFSEASKEAQISFGGKKASIGEPTGLYEFFVGRDLSVVQGCGLGGGSLINANVAIDCEPAVFQDPVWPKELRDDIENVMNKDKKHVWDMLKPNPYPDHYPHLDKTDRMRQAIGDIEDLDKILYKLPLYVTFEDKTANHVGVPQPKCTACGNCCSGCNVGAKNTLNMNYLPDAKAHGAALFTEIEVLYISKAHNSADWLVHFKPRTQDVFNMEEQIIRASHVILGAGSLGSTKILLRSKELGLDISDRLGKNFTTNGDVLGFCYNGQDNANSLGVKTDKGKKVPKHPPGPCITSVMDFRKLKAPDFESSYVIEDGTPPSVLNVPYLFAMAISSKLIGVDKFPVGESLEKAFQELTGQGTEKTMGFLCMSHDDASGQITFDRNHDDIDIEWDRVGYGENFGRVNEELEKLSRNLQGMFIKNPMWTDVFRKDVITAHPLGGCRMGDSGEHGVVNHAGQVFEGETTEVHEGLYVMDGAIISRALGVNPTMTISCLAERCVRLLAEREGWKIDYETFRPLGEFTQPKPGIRFTETMVGQYTPTEEGAPKSNCEFTVTVDSDDVERMINSDPNHQARMSGTATCPALSDAPLTISEGVFQLFKESLDHIDTKEMVYKMLLTDKKGRNYAFYGVKYVHKDHFGETGLEDTTTLFVDIYQGKTIKGKPLGKAVLYIKLPNFAKQLTTIEITNTESRFEKIKWTAKFGKFFAKSLWDIYGPVSNKPSTLNPDAPPRVKRPLRVNGVTPVVYKCVTKDKFQLKLTRYEGGSKGPVVLFHGAGVSSGIFSMDTIPINLVEFLVQHRYDVWLADFRLSCDLPWAVYQDYNLDDIAKYDYPALIDKVLEVTGQETVQVLVHCAGSSIMFCSLLSGALAGKVRSVVASQVAYRILAHSPVKILAGLFIPEVLQALGVSGITAYTDNAPSWTEYLFNKFVKASGYVSLPYYELCSNPVCHRLTFLYGLLYEHSQLNPLTHDTLHEFSGHATAKVMTHLAECVRSKLVVNFDGEHVYLPDAFSEEPLRSSAYREHIKRLDLPITFIVGEQNSVYFPDGLLQCYKELKKAHPSQEYEFHSIPDYGHLDCIFGRNAVYDVYPHLLRALDKHARDDLLTNQDTQQRATKALMQVKALTAQHKTEAPPPHPTQNSLPDPSGEVKHQDFDLDLEQPESLSYPPEAAVVIDSKEIQEVLEKLDEDVAEERVLPWKFKMTQKYVFKKEPKYIPLVGTDVEAVVEREMPNFSNSEKRMIDSKEIQEVLEKLDEDVAEERVLPWKSKMTQKNVFKKEPKYIPPVGTDVEAVVEREMPNFSNSEKRMIVALSDLHLDSIWSVKAAEKLNEFTVMLASIAEVKLNTFILLGDCVEMWLEPNSVSPLTLEERVDKWKKNEVLGRFISLVRKMAEEDDVRVYYIRGNHDHEMNAATVLELFGAKVEFIPGTLIYLINSDDGQQYRIRFAHGHDWDIYNSYSVANICERPLGYYVTRCAATSLEDMNNTEKILEDVVSKILNNFEVLGSYLSETLATTFVQKDLNETLLERALRRKIFNDETILMENGNCIKVEKLLKFQLFHHAIEKFGASRTYSMLLASLGDFDDFLHECSEDVVVLAHIHCWKCKVVNSRMGKLIYVNTGSWVDHVEECSFAEIIPPSKAGAGSVEIRHDLILKSDTTSS